MVRRLFSEKNLVRTVGWGSFMESFFLPILIDPILIGAIALKKEYWKRYTIVATIASVLGAFCAYLMGAFFFELIGERLIHFFGFENSFTTIETYLVRGVIMFTLIGAITPVPYKLVAIVAGLFHLNIVMFLLASLFGRGFRFAGVGYAAYLSRTHAHLLLPFLTWKYALATGFVLGIAATFWYF